MPKLIEEAPRDELLTRTFQVKKPNGGTLPVRVTFRPNRITLEKAKEILADEDDDGDRTNARVAANFEEYVESWDMTGPWFVDGEQVAGEDEPIPVRASVIRSVAAWITTQIISQIMEAVFPNLRESRRQQRR